MATDAISAELKSYLGGKIGGTANSSDGQAQLSVMGATSSPVDEQQVLAAVQQLQQHFATRTAPPELSVDYLSGLSVVTVRSADTGELLYQLPGSDAVRLARLVGEGAPASMGVVDTNA